MDIMDGLNKLEDFWKKVKEWGVLRQLGKIPDMLCHPRHFWQDYKSMSIKDKIVQFTTYAALFALVIWLVTYETLSLGELAKIVAMEIAALFVYVVILSLANMIVAREWKGIWFFVVFCCYTKFICLIPEVLALKGYIETETPLLMGVAILIPVLVELALLIYPAYIWQKTKNRIVWAILLSVVFLNVYDGIFIVTGMPRPKTTNFDNAIHKERFELGKSIKNAYDIPTYVFSWESDKQERFLYSNPADSVATLKYDDTEKFFAVLVEDMDSLKAISGRCRFKTNKTFFNQMYALKKTALYVYETKAYRDSPIFKQTDVMVDSVVLDRILYREYSKDVKEMNDKLFVQEAQEAEQFSKVTSVNYLGALWHPVMFISSLYSNQ